MNDTDLIEKKGKRVLTYGTFDLFHVGHLRLLERLAALGNELIVGVSTDEFNAGKDKHSIIPFEQRIEIVQGLQCVTKAIPESSWDQKARDVDRYEIDIFGMGSDWRGKFDHLKERCEVIYLDRTENISSTSLRQALSVLDESHIGDLRKALDLIADIVSRFE